MKKIKYIFDEDNEKIAVFSVDVVETPATGLEFVIMDASGETSEEVLMSNISHEKKRATGPVLVPNKPFRRSNGRMATIDADNIEKAMVNFMTKHNDGNSNIHHRYETDGVKVIENWIIDRKNGKGANKEFNNLPDGTWMQTVQFSDEIWEKDVKSGEVKGFSIAANLVPEEVTMSVLDEVDELFDELFN